MISTLKLVDTYPSSQFVIGNFTEPLWLDRARNRAGILLYFKNNMAVTLLANYTLPEDIRALFTKIVRNFC